MARTKKSSGAAVATAAVFCVAVVLAAMREEASWEAL